MAVVTDLHANRPALEATLARTDDLEAEAVYCGGDLAGYGPHPNDVCQLIEERAIATIYGNYGYAIAHELDDCGCFIRRRRPRDQRLVLPHTGDGTCRFAALWRATRS